VTVSQQSGGPIVGTGQASMWLFILHIKLNLTQLIKKNGTVPTRAKFHSAYKLFKTENFLNMLNKMSRPKNNFIIFYVSYAHCWPKESWYHSTSPPEAPLGCWGMGWLPQELLPTAPRLFWKRRLEAPWF